MTDLTTLSQYRRTRLAIRKLRKELPSFVDCAEGMLMFEVVAQAISDLADKRGYIRTAAMYYLHGDMFHAEQCGLDAERVRNVLDKLGLNAS